MHKQNMFRLSIIFIVKKRDLHSAADRHICTWDNYIAILCDYGMHIHQCIMLYMYKLYIKVSIKRFLKRNFAHVGMVQSTATYVGVQLLNNVAMLWSA